MIIIENKRKSLEGIVARYPLAHILDVTSKSNYAQVLSPFYPHYHIPIPFSPGYYSACVEGIWQGLKVFEGHDIDWGCFSNDTMKNLKRTVREYGPPKGHRKGVFGVELMNYLEARQQIYLPSYKWVLDNVPIVHQLVEKIKNEAQKSDIVFLDYSTNTDVYNVSTPLSHAGLIKSYIEDSYPQLVESI
ncbi:MAG: hypothetical protein IJ687_00705 [Bacteroidales bacterium]|nr:hypothetical protein [Bacteroidales bacterium]